MLSFRESISLSEQIPAEVPKRHGRGRVASIALILFVAGCVFCACVSVMRHKSIRRAADAITEADAYYWSDNDELFDAHYLAAVAAVANIKGDSSPLQRCLADVRTSRTIYKATRTALHGGDRSGFEDAMARLGKTQLRVRSCLKEATGNPAGMAIYSLFDGE